MMHSLIQWDQQLLRHINAEWHNSFFDWLMPFLRNSDLWVPLYFFLILLILINYKTTGWWWVLAAITTAAACDLVSSGIIKENIHRLRPCNDPALAGWVRMLPGFSRPQSSSFTSSHAANHFGIALFFFKTLRNAIGKWAYLFFGWAAFICYAQLYVGVHFPLDILGGAVVGSSIAYITSSFFNQKVGLI